MRRKIATGKERSRRTTVLLSATFGGDWYFDKAFDHEPTAYISCDTGRIIVRECGELYWADTRVKVLLNFDDLRGKEYREKHGRSSSHASSAKPTDA